MQSFMMTIYSDYICPFCYLGKGIIDVLRKNFPLDVEWLPFELHTSTPAGGVEWEKLFTGMNHENFFNNMSQRGEHLGIRFTPNHVMYNSNLALQAGEFAKELGRHEAYHEAMFTACFVDCRNIGYMETVLDIARGVGLDSAALGKVLLEKAYAYRISEIAELARSNGINSAPTFEIAGYGRIIGPKPIERFREALEAIAEGSE